MARLLDGPRAPPATGGPARQLVIFAHGYGSNGADLLGLAPFLAQALPTAAFVSPNAPERVPGFPGEAYQCTPHSAFSSVSAPDRSAFEGASSTLSTRTTPSSTSMA